MLVTIEIEIPDSVLCEYDATGEYRAPLADEPYWNDAAKVPGVGPAFCRTWNFAILRKKWQWPAGFEGVAAMARSVNGLLLAFASVPEPGQSVWQMNVTSHMVAEWMHPNLNFPCPDRWQDSLRINPNFKQ